MHAVFSRVYQLPLRLYVRGQVAGWRAVRALRSQDGQGTVEYGMLLAVIALGVAGVLFLLRDQLRAFFQSVIDTLQSATQ